MASLPQELLDNIFAFLLEEHVPVSCRLRTVFSLSKTSILSCRLVQRRWATSKTMIELFTRLIEQNPLVWQKDKLPQLQALVKSDYGRRLKMLTLCRVDQTLDLEGYRKDFYERDVRSRLVELYLTKLLQQLPRVRHVRYYLQTPRTLGSPEARTGFISKLHHFFEITRGETEWTNETAYRNPDWTIDCIQHAFKNAKMPLKSLETPLKGNRIARDAIALGPLQLSATLKRLAVNLSYDILNNRVQTWLSNMPNLEYLELAIADHQRSRFGPDYVFLVDQAHVGSNSRTALPAMKEIRLMGNMDHRFEAEDLFQFLSLFPNLERVGLAHIMFVRNDWTDFLINLADLHLSQFLLLNPRYLTPATRSTVLRLLRNEWALNRYVPTSAINDAAEDVQYIETGSPWTDDGRVPIKGTFDYVGFAIFQEL